MDWKKIKEAITAFSQKSAEVAREGVEKLTEKATEFSILNKAKMEVKAAEHKLEDAWVELGGEFYHLYVNNELKDVTEQLAPQLQKAREFREEFKKKELELQELLKKYRPEPIDKDKINTLKRELEEGGGTIEQVRVPEDSPVVGKKLRNVKLPKEVLIGTILRNDEVIIPDGTFSFAAGDHVTLLGKKPDVEEAAQILNPSAGKEEHSEEAAQ